MRTLGLVRFAGVGVAWVLAGCGGDVIVIGDASITQAETATEAAASLDCGPPTYCAMNAFSTLSIMGTIAIADADMDSLSITVCLDSYCMTDAANADAGVPRVGVDAGANTFTYGFGISTCVFTRVSPGQYAMKTDIVLSEQGDSPTGTSTSGTFTIAITSGGANVFTETVTATCQFACNICGGWTYATCSVQL